jgi:hypothetical protein
LVDANPERGLNATMALDSADRPHILYYAADLLKLNYAHFDGAQWQTTAFPGTYDFGDSPALALDHNDRPHIVFP